MVTLPSGRSKKWRFIFTSFLVSLIDKTKQKITSNFFANHENWKPTLVSITVPIAFVWNVSSRAFALTVCSRLDFFDTPALFHSTFSPSSCTMSPISLANASKLSKFVMSVRHPASAAAWKIDMRPIMNMKICQSMKAMITIVNMIIDFVILMAMMKDI